jgi:aminoglycoside phosphotransferase (APT) family kinase protein
MHTTTTTRQGVSMTAVSDDLSWVEGLMGGEIRRAERQVARRHGGRPAWFIDIDRDTETVSCYARMQRPEMADGGLALRREFDVLRALHEAGVRVPRVYAFSDSPLGILMERLPGQGDYTLLTDEAQRAVLDHQFLVELVKLHQLDVGPFAELGLRVPSSAAEYVTLDLDVWEGLYRAMIQRPVPLLEFATRWLRRNIPSPPARPALLQGDTGPGQFMFDGDRMTGIIDWELAHIGDPTLDLALIRGRDFYNPGADLAEWFRTYQALGGTKIDWPTLSYYTVKAMAITPLALAGMGQTMFPETDHAEWYAETATYGRATAEALAEAIGVPLSQVALPDPQPGRLSDMFAVMETNLRGELMPDDAFGHYRMDLVLRLVTMVRNADSLDRPLAELELDDLATVLEHRPTTLAEGDRLLNALIQQEDPDRDADMVAYLWRRAVREESLLRGALGAGERARLIPLDQLQ